MDLAILNLLERDGLSDEQRIGLRALLKRTEDVAAEDNPPLSVLADRYFTENNLPPQRQQEWRRVIRLLTESIGADVPVRAITQGHLRDFNTRLPTKPSEATGRAMSPATVQKLLSAVRAVLSLGSKQGYLTSNPADGITQLSAKPRQQDEKGTTGRALRRLGLRREDLRTVDGVLCSTSARTKVGG